MIDVNIGTQQQQQPRNANGERIDEDLVLTMAQIYYNHIQHTTT